MRAAARPIQRVLRAMTLGFILLAGPIACGTISQQVAVVLPTRTASEVALVTDSPAYLISQAIGVNLQNASAKTLYAVDGHTACTILQLQQKVGGTWQDAMPCTSRQAPRVLAIPARTTEPYTFAPGNAPDNQNVWAPGTYRVAFTFGPDATHPGTTQIFSAGFEIGASR